MIVAGALGATTTGALAAERLDPTPRIAVISAFEPELDAILARTTVNRTFQVNGVPFAVGQISGKPVVVFASGISMVNAAMTTQLALDHFNVTVLVVSGIAGGVDPNLHIGDVVVPAHWGQYLETIYARETPDGFAPPPWSETPFANYGMMFPREVEVRSAENPSGASRFWFSADTALLETAAGVAKLVDLKDCVDPGTCLGTAPRLVVGGHGVSGSAFVDNADFRRYVFETFDAQVLDMETAAVGTVAYANGVPFIAFRSLSDLAGGGAGENEMATFFKLAADNAAVVLAAFIAAVP